MSPGFSWHTALEARVTTLETTISELSEEYASAREALGERFDALTATMQTVANEQARQSKAIECLLAQFTESTTREIAALRQSIRDEERAKALQEQLNRQRETLAERRRFRYALALAVIGLVGSAYAAGKGSQCGSAALIR
jgi:DNA repair exonuclease SbcCD ATPase subunit